MEYVDVAIVGGSAAGSAAALTLARACRSVAVFDDGAPRNAAASAARGFLSRDGHAPTVLLGSAREQLVAYPQVAVHDARVSAITGDVERGFVVRAQAATVRASRVVLATGMIDRLPDVAGFASLWGRDVFHCPYCHGWEVRGRRWGVVACDRPRVTTRLEWLRNWTDDLVLFAGDEAAGFLVPSGIRVERRPITGFVTDGSGLTAVTIAGGAPIPVGALLWPVRQRLPELVAGLKLVNDEHGHIGVDAAQQTSRAGIFAAGDLSSFRRQQLIDAAASGVAAAKAVVDDLTRSRTIELSPV